MVKLCQPFFWENISVMLKTPILLNTESCDNCVSEMVNQIFLLYILGFLAGFPLSVATGRHSMVALCFLISTLFAIPTFYRISLPKSCDASGSDPLVSYTPKRATEAFQGGIGIPNGYLETAPTARNPFMNITVDEYKYNPTRPQAAPIDSLPVRIQLDDFFKTEFNRDPTDVFGRSQSQREFVGQPASTIPNDGGSFQNWLYKLPGKTCKEGGRESCFPGTDGATVPWLSSAV